MLYRNEQGFVTWLDFKLCRDRWLAAQTGRGAMDKRYVALRVDNPPQVRFFSPDAVTIAFDSKNQRDKVLLSRLGYFGWFTIAGLDVGTAKKLNID